jgi:hypothetical protein
MNEEETWTPTEKDIEWTIGHLSSITIGGVWAPGGSGLEYERTGESTLSLRKITQHPDSGEMHRRVLLTLDGTDWDIIEEEAEMVLPSLNPQEEQYQQLLRQQAIAAQWECLTEDCSCKLVDMPLENAKWINGGMQAALDENAQGIEMERWFVEFPCNECDNIIRIDPKDYGLLGGDDLFFRWATDHGVYTVLTREQVVDMVDSDLATTVCTALGSMLNDEAVPPHMRGTYCLHAPIQSGEEE